MVTIAGILSQWQTAGIFDYVLPFLLIFAVVFGILTSTNILGKQKAVHVIVALVIGLLALRLGYVQDFFREVFPRLGVGLAVIITLAILIGLFVSESEAKYWGWALAAIGFIIWIIITVGSLPSMGWANGVFFDNYAGLIIGAVLLIGVIIAVAASGGSSSSGSGGGSSGHKRKDWEK